MSGPDDAALDLAAEVGPFFVLDRWTADAGWRPLRELAERPDVLVERVAAAREMLAERSRVEVDEIEERATASIVFLGLAARLVSPAFACAALADRVPDLQLDSLWWQPTVGGPWPMARSDAAGSAPAGNLATDLDALVLRPIVTPVLEAFGRTFALSPQVLWGNVASSLAGALTMLRTARPIAPTPRHDSSASSSSTAHSPGPATSIRRTLVRTALVLPVLPRARCRDLRRLRARRGAKARVTP